MTARWPHLPGEKPKRNRYKAIRTTLDGLKFDSKGQAGRYAQLKLRQMAGEIIDLTCEPAYPIRINGQLVCTVYPDFRYHDRKTGEQVIEDFKSPATAKDPVYRLKKKLLAAVHGIEIKEVYAR